METESYLVATIKPWNIKVFNEVIRFYPGRWHLISSPGELTVEKIRSINPKYVFFPHWSSIVPEEILNHATCICFHATDLPYGRGGSPVQNLIAKGHKQTMITALRMSKELDAGPVYLKRQLSLEGLAEEIFIRIAYLTAEMIKTIIIDNPEPLEQSGEATVFKRRQPEDSRISGAQGGLQALFDHIRMLDAEGYPRAFLESAGYRFEISRPALKTGEIRADVRITELKASQDD